MLSLEYISITYELFIYLIYKQLNIGTKMKRNHKYYIILFLGYIIFIII